MTRAPDEGRAGGPNPGAWDLGPRYEVRGRLGRGGMSEVLCAFDRVRAETVAAKVLHAAVAAGVLSDEFRYAASLQHPGVVRVHDFGLAKDGRPFLTMELVCGVDLGEYARKAATVATVRAIAQVFETLDFVHARGLVHRDLKPGNILMAPRGESAVPMLVDFGLAGRRDAGDRVCAGTAYYLAPEVIAHGRSDDRADLYAMGAVLFECLTGEPPFVASDTAGILRAHLHAPVPDPRDHVPDLPAPLAEVALRLLEKDPDNRFGSAREAMEALSAWLRGRGRGRRASSGGARRARATRVKAHTPDAVRERLAERVAGPRARPVATPRYVEADGVLAELLAGGIDETGRASSTATARLVVGPTDAGKTRLLEELRVALQLRGTVTLQVACADRSGEEILDAVARALCAAPGQADAQPVPAAAPVGAEAPLAERHLVRAEVLARRLRAAFGARPCALLLDDLDRGTEGAEAAVRGLLRGLDRGAIAVYATAREVVAWARGLVSAPLHLPALDAALAGALVRSLLGELDGAADIASRAHALGGGRPGAVERLVRGWAARGDIVERGGRWVLADPFGPPLSAPSEAGLETLAQGALTGLEPSQRRLLEWLAVLGEEADASLVDALVSGAGQRLDRHGLAALAALGLVTVHGAFTEGSDPRLDLARPELAARLRCKIPASRARRWRERALLALKTRARGASPTDHPELEVALLDGLGRGVEARRLRLDAARRRLAAGEVGRARALAGPLGYAVLAGGAGEVAEEASLLLGELARRAGDRGAAVRWFERVAAQSASSRAALEAARHLGELAFEAGDVSEGQRLLEAALARSRDAAEHAQTLEIACALAHGTMLAGRLQDAERLMRDVFSDDRLGAGLPAEPRARAHKLQATLSAYRGRLDEAETEARAAAALYLEAGAAHGAATALGALGNALYRRGDLDAAHGAFRDALAQARRAGWLTGIGKCENGLAVVAWASDAWDEAVTHWTAALDAAERTDDRVERVILLNNLGFVAAARGEDDAALHLYERALAIAADGGFPKGEARVRGNLGELLGRRGELGRAAMELARCLALAQQLGAVEEICECQRRLLELGLRIGRSAAHVATAAEILAAEAEARGVTTEALHATRVAGEALARAGRMDEARVALQTAWNGFVTLGAGYDAARVVVAAVAAGLEDADGLLRVERLLETRRRLRALRALPELERLRDAERRLVEGRMARHLRALRSTRTSRTPRAAQQRRDLPPAMTETLP